ncbi:hypothetical protein BOTBODRAFT_174982 [Botryobasidium botryosum FD-172 SS1]|uniref:Uncharacterized protein n=1 Tax=Botryobasidium botryosum (strain FD-172 SS1) TaxID=930990 RepID=A0A067MF53_BOTB1|nr:hypothetical protein BOTBODRAFT_174982 [Botryobasidium botryosum FD-172 SS1]
MAEYQSEFTQLIQLINTSAHTVAQGYSDAGLPHPSANDGTPPLSAHTAAQAATHQASLTLVAACRQIIASVMVPTTYVHEIAMAFHYSVAIRVAIEAHVAEALRDAGDKGLHVNEIAKYSNINPEKLARMLRILAIHHIFKEVTPNVFANNRASLTFDKGKDAKTLAATDPAEWYEGSNGYAALFTLAGEDGMKSSVHLPDILQDPKVANSYDPMDTATVKAVGQGYWDYLSAAGNETKLRRFNTAMIGSQILISAGDRLLDCINWGELPSGSVCVDIGGGVGTQSMLIRNEHPHLKMIVQDTASLEKQAKQFWASVDPGAIPSGRVEWSINDYLGPQPVKDAAPEDSHRHNLSDEKAVQLLRRVRDACSPASKVILADHLIPFACPTPPNSETASLVKKPDVPAPLLNNMGVSRGYLLDIFMMSLYNAQERTIEQWNSVVTKADFKIDYIAGNEGAIVYIVLSPTPPGERTPLCKF